MNNTFTIITYIHIIFLCLNSSIRPFNQDSSLLVCETVISQNGDATIHEHKTENSSENQLINIGDQYGDIKSCIIPENQNITVRHESYTMKEQASHKKSLHK